MDNPLLHNELHLAWDYLSHTLKTLLGFIILLVYVCVFLSCCVRVRNEDSPEPGPKSVEVLVYRIPISGNAPHPVRLPTSSESCNVVPGLFPAHIPDVSKYWKLGPKPPIYTYWTVTQVKSYPIEDKDGLYMTIFCWDAESGMRQNHHVPKILRPVEPMYGDVFIAKLGPHQCGRHGWAEYEDIHGSYLRRLFKKER